MFELYYVIHHCICWTELKCLLLLLVCVSNKKYINIITLRLFCIHYLQVDSSRNHAHFGNKDFVQQLPCCDSSQTNVQFHVRLSSIRWHSCEQQLRLSFHSKWHSAKRFHMSLHRWSSAVQCQHFCAKHCNLHLG